MAMPTGLPERKSALLTIGEASRLLGVSEATLRQWTDEGKVKAFVTPGGHRRYNEADLKHLMRGQPRGYRLRDLAAQIEGSGARQREIAIRQFHDHPWDARLDEASRARLRERGQHLLRLVAQYISRPPLQGETLNAARALGQDYGADLAALGLSLSEALEAFILHRTPVLEAVTQLMKGKEPLQKRTLTAIDQMTHLIDQTLLALVEAHQGRSRKRASLYLNRGGGT